MAAKHRLVSLGDSLTQGFMSAAIFNTRLSYPAIIAREMGLGPDEFLLPDFSGAGGLPLNMELLLREIERVAGPDPGTWRLITSLPTVRAWMDGVEDYWERGEGTRARPDVLYHNLASWGFTVDDTVRLTARDCRRFITPPRDNLVRQAPEAAFYRTALTVLNPSRNPALDDQTAMDRARALAADGGIENLIVNLGANNVLGTVTSLTLKPTDDTILADPVNLREKFNLWLPEHFGHFFRELVEGIDSCQAERVFIATVPHVTIPPIARGVGEGSAARLPENPKYFKYYTRFWITDEDFDSRKHKHLTGVEAMRIDSAINRYNELIREAAASRPNWSVVDVNAVLDRLAFRRYRERNVESPGGSYEFPAGWNDAIRGIGLTELTTPYLRLNESNRIVQGGLFSLDGVHPTTMCYGLLAREFIEVMKSAGVEFQGPRAGNLDFSELLRQDTLVHNPPKALNEVMTAFERIDGWFDIDGLLTSVNGGRS